MKKILGVSFLALFLTACADSGQGRAVDRETGSSEVTVVNKHENAPNILTRPVVSTNAVFEAPAQAAPVSSAVEAKPSISPDVQESTSSPQQGQSAPNEQGTQVSPEPRTGDDANPDSVNPRR